MRLVTRILSVGGALVAGYGGFALARAAPPTGAPIPIGPVAALLVGAALFALGVRNAARDDPRPERWVAETPPRPARGWAMGALSLGLLTAAAYGLLGYHPILLLGWVGSWGVATRAVPAAARDRRGAGPLDLGERWLLAALLLSGAFLLLPYLGELPYVISTDEIYFTRSVQAFARGSADNPLGLAEWWGLPSLHFAGISLLAPAIGTSLEAMRLVSAAIALLTLVPLYLWIRSFHGRTVAAVAVALLAFAHAFIGWGRVALHQNAPVLLLSVALFLLASGLRRGCTRRLLWGGIALGLGFYSYPTGQLLVLIWAAALVWWRLTGAVPARAFRAAALATALGFLLAAAPMLVNAITDFHEFSERARAVTIWNPEAPEALARTWDLATPGEATRENLKRGLLAFNAPYRYTNYENPGNAFLDPVTGSLLWMGVAVALAYLRRPAMALALVGFALVYGLQLLTEGAPVHGRLLIALPFVAVLAAEALVRLSRAITGSFDAARGALVAAGVAIIAVLNLAAFHDFAHQQATTGRGDAVSAIGRTLGRNVELQGPLRRFFAQGGRWPPRQRVLFFPEEEPPIIHWGTPEDWHDWISFFADSAYVHQWPTVEAFLAEGAYHVRDELTLLLSTEAAIRVERRLAERYPHVTREAIVPNRRVSVIRVTR